MSILNIVIVFAVCYNSISAGKPRHYRNQRNSCRKQSCVIGYSCISGRCRKIKPPPSTLSCSDKQCPRNFCCQESGGYARCVKKLSEGDRCRKPTDLKCDDCPCKDGLLCGQQTIMGIPIGDKGVTICKKPERRCWMDDQCPITHCCSANMCYKRPLIGERCYPEQYPESYRACLGMCEAGAHCAENPKPPNHAGSLKFVCTKNTSTETICPKR